RRRYHGSGDLPRALARPDPHPPCLHAMLLTQSRAQYCAPSAPVVSRLFRSQLGATALPPGSDVPRYRSDMADDPKGQPTAEQYPAACSARQLDAETAWDSAVERPATAASLSLQPLSQATTSIRLLVSRLAAVRASRHGNV